MRSSARMGGPQLCCQANEARSTACSRWNRRWKRSCLGTVQGHLYATRRKPTRTRFWREVAADCQDARTGRAVDPAAGSLVGPAGSGKAHGQAGGQGQGRAPPSRNAGDTGGGATAGHCADRPHQGRCDRRRSGGASPAWSPDADARDRRQHPHGSRAPHFVGATVLAVRGAVPDPCGDGQIALACGSRDRCGVAGARAFPRRSTWTMARNSMPALSSAPAGEYQIDLQHRPPGTPRYGGHVERLIGTMMGAVHLLPGSHFSNIFERGDLDAEAEAVMTLGSSRLGWRSRSPAPTMGGCTGRWTRSPLGGLGGAGGAGRTAHAGRSSAVPGRFPALRAAGVCSATGCIFSTSATGRTSCAG